MKKMTKRIAGLTLGAALAFAIGAGVYNVYDVYSQEDVITASAAEKTVIETTVTAIEDTHNRANPDTFLVFYLSENDYSGENVAVDKQTLGAIQYYDYILIDGQKLGALVNGDQREVYYNLWKKEDAYATRWPETMITGNTISEVQEIKILAGCQFPAQTAENTVYEVKEEITFVRGEDGNFVNPATLIGAEDVDISMATVVGKASELYEVSITCDDWTFDNKGDTYDLNYYSTDRIAVRQSILINGKSVYEINTTVDDKDYVYSTEPSKSNDLKQTSPVDSKDYDVFQVPVVVVATVDSLKLQIHKDYVNSLCKTFGDVITVTVKKEICASGRVIGKGLKEDVSATVFGIGYDLTLMDGVKEFETLSILPDASLSNLPTPTKEHKTFAGWVDADGNPAPATMPDGNYTLYAKWAVVPYELTIVYMDATTKTFTFGIEVDEENGIELSVDDLKAVLQENLPAETEETAYGYVEKVPSVFKAQDYTFTVTTVKSVFTITFTDEDGNDIGVAPITFTKHTIDDLVLPAVPEREGYTGEWNKTTDRLKWEDVTLYAVYTEIKEETKLPEVPDSSEDENDKTSDTTSDSTTNEAPGGIAGLLAGCSGVVGGVAGGIAALGIAVVAVLKKKED